MIQLGLNGFIRKGDFGRRSKFVLLDPFCRAQCDNFDFLPSNLLVRLQLHRHNDSRHRTRLVGELDCMPLKALKYFGPRHAMF